MSEECCGPRQGLTIGARPTATVSGEGRRDDERRADSVDHDDHEARGDGDAHGAPPAWWRDPGLRLPLIAGVLLAVGWTLEWTGLEIPAVVAQSVSLLAGALTFVPGAIRRLLRRRLGVGLLMTIAAVGAVALGHVGEAAALAFLFSIAEALEDRAMDRAKYGLRALLDLTPQTARLSKLAGEVVVPASEVRVLDVLVVPAGERVATDGVVVAGRSSVDTSAVT